MKRVLLTGATGFIGRHCTQLLLARGYEVHAVSSKTLPQRSISEHWHQVDLLDPVQVSQLVQTVRPTHLLHFAWCLSPGDYWTSLTNFRWLQASLNLLESFALHRGRRVVMAGTCAEYDWNFGCCTEEATPLSPTTLYGACKHSLDALLRAFAQQAGLSAAWGRIFSVYGPHENPTRLVPSVIRSLFRSEAAQCTHGEQVRDFLYVKDVADAFVCLLESNVEGAINIASGCPVSLREVVCKIAEKMNGRDLIQFGAMSTHPSDPPVLLADVGRLSNEVGWSPKYNLSEGVDETIEWWRMQQFESIQTER